MALATCNTWNGHPHRGTGHTQQREKEQSWLVSKSVVFCCCFFRRWSFCVTVTRNSHESTFSPLFGYKNFLSRAFGDSLQPRKVRYDWKTEIPRNRYHKLFITSVWQISHAITLCLNVLFSLLLCWVSWHVIIWWYVLCGTLCLWFIIFYLSFIICFLCVLKSFLLTCIFVHD